MEEAQLRSSLLKLREEIDRLGPEDAAARERLDGLMADLERRLSHPEDAPHHANLVANVRDAIEQFEVEHPRTTAMLNQLMVTLANMGI